MKTNYPFLTKKQILTLIDLDANYAAQCVSLVYQLQTPDEQEAETTRDRNRRGFMSSHAVAGSKLAKKLQDREDLTPEDLAQAQALARRYGKQLATHFRQAAVQQTPALADVAKVFGV